MKVSLSRPCGPLSGHTLDEIGPFLQLWVAAYSTVLPSAFPKEYCVRFVSPRGVVGIQNLDVISSTVQSIGILPHPWVGARLLGGDDGDALVHAV